MIRIGSPVYRQRIQVKQYQKRLARLGLFFVLLLMGVEIYMMLGSSQLRIIKQAPEVEKVGVQKDSNYLFQVPKTLWIGDVSAESYLMGLIVANNQDFAQKSGFEGIVINRQNFKRHLSEQGIQNVQKFITLIEKNHQGHSQRGLQDIIRTFIMLNILYERGGVMTDGRSILVEKLDWLKEIMKNPYVSRGNRGVLSKVVGFYSANQTFEKKKENIKPFEGMHEMDRYVGLIPAVEEYFIAAQKGAIFIKELFQAIEYQFLPRANLNPFKFTLRQKQDYFNRASRWLLTLKQQQIDISNSLSYRQFAIDHYGLNLINCNFGPYMHYYFFRTKSRQLESFARYTTEEYAAHYGPIRYIIRMFPFETMSRFLEEVRDGRREPIWDRSIYQTFLFPKGGLPFIKENKERFITNQTNQQWTTLPKIIWLFYDSGLEKATITSQICVQNMRRIAKRSGWQVNVVTLANGHQYLDQQTLDKIQHTLDNFKLIRYSTTLSDIYRLALISRHGGVYLDTTFVLFQDLEWIVNIGRYPSQYIYNRFGHLPKCLLYWGPQDGSPINWQIDQRHNTKNIWHLAYESNLIAAEKGNDFVTEWLEMLLRLYQHTQAQVREIYDEECNITSDVWILPGYHYLTVMDAVKCVAGKRQLALQRSGNRQYAGASDYYKLWSLNGYMGQQKIRVQTSFEKPLSNDPILAYRYPVDYVQGLIGKFHHAFKFFHDETVILNRIIGEHIDGDFRDVFHPDSFFMRHMWRQDFSLVKKGDRVHLQTKQ